MNKQTSPKGRREEAMSFGNERALFTILQFLYPLFGEEIQQEIKGFLIRNEQSDPRTAENAQGGESRILTSGEPGVTDPDLRGPGGESQILGSDCSLRESEIQEEIENIFKMVVRGLKMRFKQ